MKTPFLYLLLAYSFSGVLIIVGLYFLRFPFKRISPEERIAGKKELPDFGYYGKAKYIFIGAGFVTVGVDFILRMNNCGI